MESPGTQLVTTFDYREPQLHSQLFETINLARDERFRETRVSLEDVSYRRLSLSIHHSSLTDTRWSAID
jgi:hypothetical protein